LAQSQLELAIGSEPSWGEKRCTALKIDVGMWRFGLQLRNVTQLRKSMQIQV
jgi:alanine racemase